ncbi:MAG: hypothetical protein A2X18_11735 [Bacteroidetes bacterium GWF2_40_14]|nr:MAG: hypothetical protein A2X18_11735 [Bacteroidetes bacterium GWF2_40_14]
MKKIIYLFIPAVIAILFACENEKNTFSDVPTIYLSGDPAQNAKTDSVIFSFKLLGSSVTDYDINLIVNIAGIVSDKDRKFELEIVPEKTNVTAENYTLGELVVPAKSFKAIIPVNLKRSIPGINLLVTNARLTLKVKSNENFSIGAIEYATYTIAWCDYLVKPSTWSNVINYYIGPFTQSRFKFIIDYTGLTSFESLLTNGSFDYNKQLNFQAKLIGLLNKYNSEHPGNPYLNDNGQPLQFGAGLTN